MTKKIEVPKFAWQKKENRYKYCHELEKGNLLFFPEIPFDFSQDEIEFLLSQRQKRAKNRKNIAYKPDIDKVSNHDVKDPLALQRLHHILRDFSRKTHFFLSELLSPYAKGWKLDYASFRPFEEKGRNLRKRARNDLLHIDAFPTRPLHGARILRFFININPKEDRHWITSDHFSELATRYAGTRVPFPISMDYSFSKRWKAKMIEFLKKRGVKIALRSPYDRFMLEMHHFLKEDEEFQKNCPKDHWEFPPGSCWAVFTDQVSHAALSGQYALEQTFIIPQRVLLFPELSPVSILERLMGKNLVNPKYLERLFS